MYYLLFLCGFTVEQIKGPEEVRECIVAAARAARQGPDCPPELRAEYNPSQHPLCDHLIHYDEHHITHNGMIDFIFILLSISRI